MIGVAAVAHCADPKVDTSGWKPYRSERLGFEVRHPGAWVAREGVGTTETVIVGEPPTAGQTGKQLQFIVQRGINPKGLGIHEWFRQELARQRSAMPPAIADTTLAGRPAVRIEHVGTLGRQFVVYTVLSGTDIFQVAISQPAGEAKIDPLYEVVLASLRLPR